MLDEHYFETINVKDFEALLKTYKDVIPEKLSALEEQRLTIIPKALSERKPAYLTKAEVQTLVDWKLSHGKFRPSLKQLVASNSEQAVQKSTEAAFSLYAEDHDKWDQTVAMLAKDLRGVGPATASLLLSVYDEEKVPFFSDELFRWALGKGHGWDKRKLNYSIGEYKQMFGLVRALMERLGERKVRALDAEMVAYVLGKRQGADEVQTTGRKRKPKESEQGLGAETTAAETTAAEAKPLTETVTEADGSACTRGSSNGAKRRSKRMRLPLSEGSR